MPMYSISRFTLPARRSAARSAPPLWQAWRQEVQRGGYDNVFEAARHMGKLKDEYYRPNAENVALYNELYAEYKLLHDYFGRGANDVMKRLKQLKLSLFNE